MDLGDLINKYDFFTGTVNNSGGSLSIPVLKNSKDQFKQGDKVIVIKLPKKYGKKN